MKFRGFMLLVRLPMLACMGLFFCIALLGCVSSESSRLDALTTPQPNALRERALRRLSLATAYFDQGQNTVAQQEVRAALQIDPNYADAYNLLGLIHQRDGAANLAEQSFQQALNLAMAEPSLGVALANVQHNYGWFLCEQNRWSDAHIQLSRALTQRTYSQTSKTWMALGICQRKAGQINDARISFENAFKQDDRNSMVRYQWASLEQNFNPAHAQELLMPLNRSTDANPASLSLGIQLALQLAQVQEAQALMAQLTHNFPNSTQARAWIQKTRQDQ